MNKFVEFFIDLCTSSGQGWLCCQPKYGYCQRNVRRWKPTSTLLLQSNNDFGNSATLIDNSNWVMSSEKWNCSIVLRVFYNKSCSFHFNCKLMMPFFLLMQIALLVLWQWGAPFGGWGSKPRVRAFCRA